MNKQKIGKSDKSSSYDVGSIQVLEGIEAIRTRPGMYIGSSGKTEENSGSDEPRREGVDQLAWEIVENSIDEAVASKKDFVIKVKVSNDQKTLTIEDNGRGIPIGIHPDSKKSTLETIFTVLHSGGKFDNKAYKSSGGLHGVGVTVVNALSKKLQVSSYRDGLKEEIIFERGKLVSSRISEQDEKDSGMITTFTPDEEIFKDFTHFKVEVIGIRLKELAYLNSNLTIEFFVSSSAEPLIYHYESGLAGLVQANSQNPLDNTKIFHELKKSKEDEEYFYFELAWQYQKNYKKSIVASFCNNINTSDGGTHVEGFESGFVSALREWIKEKQVNLKSNIIKEDVLEGLSVAIAVRISDPEFSGQTKGRLSNRKVREVTKNWTYELVKSFLQENPETAERIVKKIVEASQIRTKIEEQQGFLRGESRVNTFLPGKLADCIIHGEGSTLFISEGLSAASNVEDARNPYKDASLGAQGKIINSFQWSADIFKNKEIKDLTNALGYSPKDILEKNYYQIFFKKTREEIEEGNFQITEDFNYEEDGEKKIIPSRVKLNYQQVEILIRESKKYLVGKLRYGKIVIMADADPDGKHIECLLLTFFVCYFRFLLEEQRIFLAVPPLYQVKNKKGDIKYLYSNNELTELQNSTKETLIVKRFKGLGEMNPEELRFTSMGENSPFHRMILPEGNVADEVIESLMGEKSNRRKEMLESGEHKNSQLIVGDDSTLDISQAMPVKFLEYAYKVVEDRALPQVQDGLKPVQRRILYTLYDLNLFPNRPHRKSAKIIGDVMGKFHPHGDQSIYQAMVKMAQDFNYRYPLIDGQGNWGSLSGGPAAAMRYTEARLTTFGAYLLKGLPFFRSEDFIDNYDQSEKEPKVLDASLNLLLNGSNGIAVGMSTNIPPHNLVEIVDATIFLIENPEASLREMLWRWKCQDCSSEGVGENKNYCFYCKCSKLDKEIIGPDFPTGGEILEKEKLLSIYEKGEGTIYVRAKAELSENGKEIKINQIPYKINKTKLLIQINEKIKKDIGIKKVNDYSNLDKKVDIRIEIHPGYDWKVILNKLYKSTDLQSSFSIKMRALVDDKPRIFSFKEIIQAFVEKSLEDIKKKALFIYREKQKDLINLETRRFIVKNQKQILEIVNENDEQSIYITIAENFSEEISELTERLIKTGAGEEKDKENLEKEVINKILDTSYNFRQFTQDRREKLENQIVKAKEEIEIQISLVNEEEKRKETLINELNELKKDYKEPRRTILSSIIRKIDEKSLIPSNEERIIVFSRAEKEKIRTYLTVFSLNSLDETNIASQGKELKTQGDNWSILKIKRRSNLWCFTNYGKVYLIEFYQFNTINRSINLEEHDNKKRSWIKFQDDNEFVTFVLPVPEDYKENGLLVITKNGKVKLFDLNILSVKRNGRYLFNNFKKIFQKCPLHNQEKEELNLKNCINCIEKKIWNGDEIREASLVSLEEDELSVIVKKRERKNSLNFKNLKLPLYRKKRIGYCEEHKNSLLIHKTEICCDKSKGVGAYSSCVNFHNIQHGIKECNLCNSPFFFKKALKRQIKADQILTLIKTKSNEWENKNYLILSRKDNTFEKKSLNKIKTYIAADNSVKKSIYCKRHYQELEKEELNFKELKEKEIESKERLIKEVIETSLFSTEMKFEMLKNSGIKTNQEIRNKVENSSYNELDIREAIEGRKESLKETFIKPYKEALKVCRSQEDNLIKLKEKLKNCKDCRKFCEKHQGISEKAIDEHKIGSCCGNKIAEALEIKENIKEISLKIDESKNSTDPEKLKDLSKLKTKLNKLAKKLTEINRQAFMFRRTCPKMKETYAQINDCYDCKRQKELKYQKLTSNPVTHVNLINTDDKFKYEVYLLSKNSVHWYNKKDLKFFLESSSKAKTFIKDRKKIIDDVKFYSKDVNFSNLEEAEY